MNIDFQKARENMVESQLRPNKITNKEILKLFNLISKEDFLSENDKLNAYSDSDIQLDHHRGYLKNLHIAQLLLHSEINVNDKILHLGAMSGYVSIMLSKLGREVVAIENNEDLESSLKNNLIKFKINNIKPQKSDFDKGYIKDAPFDLIFIDNPVYDLTKNIKDQINFNSGKIVFIKKIDDFLCKAYKIKYFRNNFQVHFLFDVFSKYELYKKEKTEFIF
tara:strand:+ start:144 stop:806 length:663 start_codon:yes stop_codon:yes gene_type:complete